MKIYIQHKKYCTHSKQSREQYGSWSASYDSSVTGASLTFIDHDDEEFEVSFECVAGTPVFILSMTYGTGDSFGSSSGNQEIIWVFNSADTALVAKKTWEQACDKHDDSLSYEDRYSVEFFDENHNKIKLSNPAAGYFENMEDITLSTFHFPTQPIKNQCDS